MIESSTKINARPAFYLSLEILRGLCALEVVIWHCFARIDDRLLHANRALELTYHGFLRGSDIAVIGFFVLSGFVTSASFAGYFHKYKPLKATLVFYAARMLRIWPVTILSVLVSVGLAWHYRTLHGDWTKWGRYDSFALPNILASALGLSSQWNTPMWTIAYELSFYSILPCLMLIILSRSYLTKGIAALAMFTVGYGAMTTLSEFGFCIPFGAGMLIYFARDSTILQRLFQSRVITVATFLLVVVSLVYLSCEYLPDNPYSVGKYLLVTLGVLGLVFHEPFFTKHKDAGAVTILSRLSMCSYSLYLWHWPVIWFTAMYMFHSVAVHSVRAIVVLFSIAIPILILVTGVSWYVIERNARMKKILPWIDNPQRLWALALRFRQWLHACCRADAKGPAGG